METVSQIAGRRVAEDRHRLVEIDKRDTAICPPPPRHTTLPRLKPLMRTNYL